MFAKIAPKLHGMGYEVLPIIQGQKRPSVDEWQSIEITEDRVAAWAANGKAHDGVGVRTGTGKVAVYAADNDILDKDVAVLVRKSFVEHFGEGVVRIGQAPKSLMVYQGAAGQVKITSPTWQSPDGERHKFELLGAGQQFVAYGRHQKTGKDYRWPGRDLADVESWETPELDFVAVQAWVSSVLPTLIPADWKIESEARVGVVQPTDAGERALLNYKPKLDLTWDEVVRLVMSLDADMGHDEWVRVMMAIHHQSGGSDEGLALVHDWSSLSDKYRQREVDLKWRSIKDDPSRGSVVTMASVLKMVPTEKKVEAYEQWLQKIEACAEPHALQALAEDEIARDRTLAKVDLARLADAVHVRLAALGVRMGIRDVRAMVAPARRAEANHGAAPMEPWATEYVWCQHEDCFVRIPTQQLISVQSFNANHGRDVRDAWTNEDGFTPSAAHVALQELQIPVVDRRMYLPWADTFFDYNGMSHLNSYRPSSVPVAKASSAWNDNEKALIKLIRKHIETLIGKEDAAIVLNWMAWSVQNPGKKIRWSLLIKGIEGDGKSFLGNVMEAAIGLINVGRVSPKVLNTDFNGWAEGHCICVVEELKLTGHNRHDVLNALKELHTNPTVTIHRKGIDAYPAPNTQNYMAFTNFNDAIPVTDGDRRWFISFSRFNKPEELIEAGMDAKYFKEMFDALEECAEAVRGWLLEMDVSAFEANGRAPDSLAKRVMVAATAHEEDEVAREIIADGIVGVSPKVISTAHLTNHISMTYPDVEIPRGPKLASMMSRLGFYKVTARIKWKGAACRVWVAQLGDTSSPEQIRALLDETDIEDVVF